jgi:TetR/AcrR family transcriptional regulator, repressor for neighboring sulfatase
VSIEVPIRRIRRTAEAAREAALEAARHLLLADGPSAVTLKAVAARIGTGHANLLHHFGSAEGLQTALMERMIRDTVGRVERAVERLRSGEAGPREIVDLVFDAHTRDGIGRLTAWLASTGEAGRLRPLFDVLRDLIRIIEAGAVLPADEAHRRIVDITLLLVLASLGDSLIGPMLHDTLGEPPGRARDIVAGVLLSQMSDGK